MRSASALRWPWLATGSVPPVDSMRMSDQKRPVEILTEATWEIEMLSSLLPNQRRLTRLTRRGLTVIRVGKRKLPFVQRLAVNLSSPEVASAGIDARPLTPTPARLSAKI